MKINISLKYTMINLITDEVYVILKHEITNQQCNNNY